MVAKQYVQCEGDFTQFNTCRRDFHICMALSVEWGGGKPHAKISSILTYSNDWGAWFEWNVTPFAVCSDHFFSCLFVCNFKRGLTAGVTEKKIKAWDKNTRQALTMKMDLFLRCKVVHNYLWFLMTLSVLPKQALFCGGKTANDWNSRRIGLSSDPAWNLAAASTLLGWIGFWAGIRTFSKYLLRPYSIFQDSICWLFEEKVFASNEQHMGKMRFWLYWLLIVDIDCISGD